MTHTLTDEAGTETRDKAGSSDGHDHDAAKCNQRWAERKRAVISGRRFVAHEPESLAMSAGDGQSAAEQRWAARRHVELSGYIFWDSCREALPVIVRDMSSCGALLELTASARSYLDSIGRPDKFVLVMSHLRERSEVLCSISRSSGNRIGVRFIGCFMTTNDVPKRQVARCKKTDSAAGMRSWMSARRGR